MTPFKFLTPNQNTHTYPEIITDPGERLTYNEGWIASHFQDTMHSCPYDLGTRNRRLWILGFLDQLVDGDQ